MNAAHCWWPVTTLLLLCCSPSHGAFPGRPVTGTATQVPLKELNRLKNRSSVPTARDIDTRVSLAALSAPGQDRRRWANGRAATIAGYVRSIKVGGVESVNCSATEPLHRDTHIELIGNPLTPDELPVIAEVTPYWRERMLEAGVDWSTDRLRAALLGRWVRITGWLFFDSEHASQSEHTQSRGAAAWRATAWEIHPVTSLEVAEPPR